MEKIKLAQNKYALVSNKDFSFINSMHWYLSNKYVETKLNDKRITMHRLILGLKKGDGKYVDHIDGNKLNNQRKNLRICTQSQNMSNRGVQKNTTTGYKGVCFQKDKRWGLTYIKAQITVRGKNIHIGLFKTLNEGAKAYNKMALKHFGKFAKLNKLT